MKNKKISIITAVILGTSVLMTGCESGTLGENPPEVSANPITEKFTFKDSDNSYKIVFNNPWRAVKADDDAYDVAFVNGESEDESPYKISVRCEDTTEETDTLDKAREYYTREMYGIKKTSGFKLNNTDGIWTICSSATEEGYTIDGIDAGDNKDDNEPYYEIGIVVNNSKVYIVKYEPKSKTAADEYRDEAIRVLEGMKFKK